MTDPIDKAIAAEAAKPPEMAQHQAIIASTGRPVVLLLPMDATDGEILEVVGWIGNIVLGWYRQERAKTAVGRIVVAKALPQ